MINWKEVIVGTSPLTGSIFIGKTKKNKQGYEEWTDRSDDKTQVVLRGVMEWFLHRYNGEHKDSVELKSGGKKYTLKLIVEDIDEVEDDK